MNSDAIIGLIAFIILSFIGFRIIRAIYRLIKRVLSRSNNNSTSATPCSGTSVTSTSATPCSGTSVTSAALSALSKCNFTEDGNLDILEDVPVAGITFHDFSHPQSGYTFGYTLPEPNNPHDRHAIALFSHDNRLIGYIPRKYKSDYLDLTNNLPISLPFICHFKPFINDSNRLTPSATLTLYHGDSQTITSLFLQTPPAPTSPLL